MTIPKITLLELKQYLEILVIDSDRKIVVILQMF